MSTEAQPLVSIGLPVYNGEQFLGKAITTLLSQDYSNFELIISDNNSQDSTANICREFEAADPRIRYIRQAENHGSPWNFTFVLEQSQGDYFMWAAHDDMWDPTYISKCLCTLEAHPEAVLCCSEVNFIGAEDKPFPIYPGWKNLETLGMTRVERVHRLISVMGWYALYGLLRPEAIRKVTLGASDFGGDVVMTLELMLLGHIVKVHEPLFYYRITKMKSAADFQADFNSEKNPLPPPLTPWTGLVARLFDTVCQSDLSQEEKRRVLADFICTMSSPNLAWRPSTTAELLGPVALNDAAFAYLLAHVLARSVPLSEIGRDPLLRVLYLPPPSVPDILRLAAGMAADRRSSAVEKQRQGVRLCEQGKVEEACRSFAEALKLEETSDRWVDWATTQIARNQTSEAEQGLRHALQLDPSHTLAALKLGIIFAGQDRFESAIPLLEQSLPALEGAQRNDAVRLLEVCKVKAGVPGRFATQFSQTPLKMQTPSPKGMRPQSM